jgi:HAD superfamily hydrolase (TIGR01549 family)
MAQVAILDIDGTLVDTNYQHALAWFRAFKQHKIILPLWRIHRHIGMGGDQFVPALAGDEAEEKLGEDVRAAEKALYFEMIDEVQVMPGARELLDQLTREDLQIVLASSAKEDEVDHYLDLLDARERVHAWTTSADVQETKPEPDLLEAALQRADSRDAVMVGDSIWDCQAAERADVSSVAVLTGGFCEPELRKAGAGHVFQSLEELCDGLAETPLVASES